MCINVDITSSVQHILTKFFGRRDDEQQEPKIEVVDEPPVFADVD